MAELVPAHRSEPKWGVAKMRYYRDSRAISFLPRCKSDQKDFIASAYLNSNASIKRFLEFKPDQILSEFEA